MCVGPQVEIVHTHPLRVAGRLGAGRPAGPKEAHARAKAQARARHAHRRGSAAKEPVRALTPGAEYDLASRSAVIAEGTPREELVRRIVCEWLRERGYLR